MNPKFAIAALYFQGQMFAFDITLDYSHDNFFTNIDNPYGAVGQAAIQAAADEISGLITNSLAPITNDVISASSGGATAQFTMTYNYVDPNTGSTTNLLQRSPTGIGADEIVVYVGARSMDISTYAEASPGTPSVSIGGGGSEAGWVSAMSQANTAMNLMYGRGGYDMQRISGGATFGSTTANYDLNFGPVTGSMWFNDSLGDSSSGRESWEENNDFWHFDHTTEVDTGKIDIYSIALHEILHVLGYGTSESWDDYTSGSDWTGPEASALLGTGEDALHSDGYHIASGLESPGYEDGVLRNTVMNRSPVAGERDQLTLLDLAFLQDSGYEIGAIPEPQSAILITLTCGLFLKRRR
ncbi:MAG: hypothetical protein ACSHYB_04500 [Roseibacillus sp.]